MKLSGLGRFRDLGLLAMRIGLGASFMAHGYPKLAGGPAVWEKVGGAMGLLAVPGPPAFRGFAALSEFGGASGLTPTRSSWRSCSSVCSSSAPDA
jgi:putative oxidoreductase